MSLDTTATPTSAMEYLHDDHLGSLAAATDATGASLLSLAHDPYGTRRGSDWTAALPAAEVASLAAGQDEGRARQGFTGHEPLDRTGFVHMGARLYDPRLGRFLSPDPIVSEPWSGQGWNLYSYVGNSPLSRTDPTGLCYAPGPYCQVPRGGGFSPVSPALAGAHFYWRVRLVISVRWSWASFGLGLSLWNGDRSPHFFAPHFSLHIGAPQLASTPTSRMVSLGQEMSPADGRMSSPLPSWLMFSPAELASIGVSFLPVVGSLQSVGEVLTGRDLITGEEVHRGVALIGIAAGLLPGGKGVVRVASEAIGRRGRRGGLIPLRRRMEAEAPRPSPRAEAHHELPRTRRDDFERAGLDIDDPRYGRWVEPHPHRKWSSAYNKEWDKFFRGNPGATQAQILGKLDELRKTGNYQ